MEKYGEVTENSISDYDNTKKAEFYDEEGFGIADAANKDKLAKPAPIAKLAQPDQFTT